MNISTVLTPILEQKSPKDSKLENRLVFLFFRKQSKYWLTAMIAVENVCSTPRKKVHSINCLAKECL